MEYRGEFDVLIRMIGVFKETLLGYIIMGLADGKDGKEDANLSARNCIMHLLTGIIWISFLKEKTRL